jgi:glycosyltransferase involved in cell wall biosynthesis
MKKLLTMCSSHRRYDMCKRMVESWATTKRGEGSNLVVYVDEQNPYIDEYKRIIMPFGADMVFGPYRTMVQVLNYLSSEKYTNYDYYSECNDDHVFVTEGWDTKMMEAIDRKNNGVSIAYGQTQNMPTATMAGAKIIRKLGYFFPPEYNHSWVDNWLTTIGFKCNLLTYCPDVLIDHRHPAFGLANSDETYKGVESDYPHGKAVFDAWKAGQYEKDVEAITEYIKSVKPPAQKGKISLCMIVRNEEKFLSRCLDSAIDHVDEIIIVDTGSKDQTREIARKYTDMVFDLLWREDFSEARNYGLDLASGDYILFLDGDDVLINGAAIRDMVRDNPDKAISCRLQNVRDGEQRDYLYQVRLFPNRPDIRFERRVHEGVGDSLNRTGLGVVPAANFHIEHLGYRPENILSKAQRNSRLLAKDYDKYKDCPFWWSSMGDAAAIMDLSIFAEMAYFKVIELRPDADISMYAALSIMISRVARGSFDGLAEYIGECIERKPWNMFYLVLGETYMMQGNAEEAKKALRGCLRNGVDMPTIPGNLADCRILAASHLSRIEG